MEFRTNFIVVCIAVALFCSSANAQRRSPPAPPADILTPAPAPSPEPAPANLTYLLSFAGPFQKFLGYLQSTKVLETFQSQANDTKHGITIFVPKDDAFTSQKKPSLSNLTQDQLRSLLLFHAIPKYYSLSDFNTLSESSPVQTNAGGTYTLNVTKNTAGVIRVNTGWTSAKVISSVHDAVPLSLHEVDKVLLPVAIFGTDIPPPPPPAPAPAPSIAPAADAPEGKGKGRGGAASKPGDSAAADIGGRLGSIFAAWAVVMLSWSYL